MQPNDKLDFSAISFDDVIGDGAPGLETPVEEVPQNVEEVEEEILDENPRERGDEDQEDFVDEEYDDEDDQRTVEDEGEDQTEEYDDEDEDLPIADKISNILGFELETEYADTVEGLTNFVRDMSEEVAENQIQDLFQEFPEVQAETLRSFTQPTTLDLTTVASSLLSKTQHCNEQCWASTTRPWVTKMSSSWRCSMTLKRAVSSTTKHFLHKSNCLICKRSRERLFTKTSSKHNRKLKKSSRNFGKG